IRYPQGCAGSTPASANQGGARRGRVDRWAQPESHRVVMSRPTRRILLVVCAAVLPLACSGPPAAPDASDGSMVTLCSTNAECAGGFCDGTRLCVPGAAEADARGCVTVTPACGAGEVCDAELERCVPACEVPDADGDGVDSVECGGSDCDDNDANRYPGNAEVCDA